MATYKVIENIIYYIEANNKNQAMEKAQTLDKADAKYHNLEVEVSNWKHYVGPYVSLKWAGNL